MTSVVTRAGLIALVTIAIPAVAAPVGAPGSSTSVAAGTAGAPALEFADAVESGRLRNRRIAESSGMAASTRHPGLLWTINDSGSGPDVFLLDAKGTDLGRVRVSGVRNRDWEDMASYVKDGKHYLLIGDVGDNGASRAVSRIVGLREPPLGDDGRAAVERISAEWTMRFRYEDGPRDCESIAVDPEEGRIYLLTKRLVPAALYVLPLEPPSDAKTDPIYVARRLGPADAIEPPSPQDLIDDPLLGGYSSQPTAMDFSPDGLYAVVLTYRDAFLFVRHGDEPWLDTLNRRPRPLGLPRLVQAESLAVGGTAIYVTSEEAHAPILRIERLAAPD